MQNKLKSLYDILPAIDCPVCGKKSKIAMSADTPTSQECGANLTTSHLTISALRGSFVYNKYSIDVLSGDIVAESYDHAFSPPKKLKMGRTELLKEILTFTLQAGYCINATECDKRPIFYTHYLDVFQCKIDPIKSKLISIEKISTHLSDIDNGVFKSVETDSSTTEIRVGTCGQPATTSLKVKALSLSKCIELLKNNKYTNWL